MDNLKKFAPYVAIFVLILLIIFFTSQKNEMKNGALPNNFSTHADNLDEAIKNVPQIQFFTPLKEPLDLKIVDGKEFCFADYSFSVNNDATYMLDGGTMRLKIDGSKVTGKSVFAIAEKDAWITTYEGAVKDLDLKTNTRVLDVWEEQQSEGSTYPKENKKLILTGDNVKESDVPENAHTAVYCDELNEWQGIYKYVTDNFGTYPGYIIVDYDQNRGKMAIIVEKDKNNPNPYNRTTQELKDFFYTTNDQHEVIDLKLN